MNVNEKPFVDENYLREIMNKYGTPLLKLVYSYVKNWTTAEDIVQETFITFAQKHYQFKGKSSLKTWLYQIAINKSKDFLKSPKNKLSHFSFNPFVLTSKGEEDENKLIDDDESRLISECLFKLTIKYREVLTLFYYEELSIKEISNVLCISEGNVKTRLSRGREKFKHVYLKEVKTDGRKIKQAKNIIG
ncbi:sigma-70 family RNA polymerase sigma factor [Metabacillus endolithicus]|uniref:Sigma-70 family RNA polymerase sigma factor n=1 Tax=Metabacillus endolithicus TaxID=1535204 RepID=A0ABW5C2G8_9BACI|nr:sigma-70 family RNA polymerase sigma factor [Metabacillus endolithicus]UPG66066.1 sigma-70 family RNA polymerase sigma factor [Metabacillus endolithicus]